MGNSCFRHQNRISGCLSDGANFTVLSLRVALWNTDPRHMAGISSIIGAIDSIKTKLNISPKKMKIKQTDSWIRRRRQ